MRDQNPDDDPFSLPDLPTDAIEQLPAAIAASREQITLRARDLWRRGGADALGNWLRAEREASAIASRAAEIEFGGVDALEAWRRAESEIDAATTAG